MSSNSVEFVSVPLSLEASMQQFIAGQQAIPGDKNLDLQLAVPMLRELLEQYAKSSDNVAPYNREVRAALQAADNEVMPRRTATFEEELVRILKHINANLPQGGICRLHGGDLLFRIVEAVLKKIRMLSAQGSVNDLLATIDFDLLEGLVGVIDSDSLKQLIARDKRVKKLWFSNDISLKNLEALAVILTHNPHVTDIEIKFASLDDAEVQALTLNKHVRTLVLKNCRLVGSSAQILATMHLDLLDISHNEIGDIGAVALAANPYLRMLGASNCGIGRAGVQALSRSPSLQYLGLGGTYINQISGDALQSNPRLVWLTIDDDCPCAAACKAAIDRNRALYGEAALVGAIIKGSSSDMATLAADSIMQSLYEDNQAKLQRAKKGVRFFENTVLPRLIRQNKWAIAKPVNVASDVMEQSLTSFEATHPVTVAQAFGLLRLYIEEATKAIKEGYELAPGLQYATEMQTALNKFAKQHNPALSEQARLMQLVRLMEASLHCTLQQLKKSGPVWRIAQAILCQQLTGVLGAATVQRIVQCDPTLTTLELPSERLSDDDTEALLRLLARNRVIKSLTHCGNAIDVAEFVVSCNEQRSQMAAQSTEVTLKLG